jgi:hypothetical protein
MTSPSKMKCVANDLAVPGFTSVSGGDFSSVGLTVAT